MVGRKVHTAEELRSGDLGIAIEQRPSRAPVEKLSCSKCGGPLNLVAPDQAQRIICPNCGAIHDIDEGNLRYFAGTARQI